MLLGTGSNAGTYFVFPFYAESKKGTTQSDIRQMFQTT
jgi:hypothetical protein